MRQWTRTTGSSAMGLGPAQKQLFKKSPEMRLTNAEFFTILHMVDTEDAL